MDFKDWRVSSPESVSKPNEQRSRGKRFADHFEEQMRDAEERGVFRNLPGLGQPLNLDVNPFAGEKALGYSLLKSNNHLPVELELAREITLELERLETRRAVLRERGRHLRHRRVPPFASEKCAYNTSVARGLIEYEASLRELNRKILTLNLSTPASMHRVPLDVEVMVREFREQCPLLG